MNFINYFYFFHFYFPWNIFLSTFIYTTVLPILLAPHNYCPTSVQFYSPHLFLDYKMLPLPHFQLLKMLIPPSCPEVKKLCPPPTSLFTIVINFIPPHTLPSIENFWPPQKKTLFLKLYLLWSVLEEPGAHNFRPF